jgi:hypothetical protein
VLTDLAAAAFDTRVNKPLLPGSAAHKAHRRLRRLGCRMLAPAESFHVAVTRTTGHVARRNATTRPVTDETTPRDPAARAAAVPGMAGRNSASSRRRPPVWTCAARDFSAFTRGHLPVRPAPPSLVSGAGRAWASGQLGFGAPGLA